MLDKCWISMGVKIVYAVSHGRVNFGVEMLGKCWVNVGYMLGKCWPIFSWEQNVGCIQHVNPHRKNPIVRVKWVNFYMKVNPHTSLCK